jgi:regulator of protease activity HflC (stomatin/prohibitin superfamily)
VSDEEREILLAARQRASEVLSASSSEAKRIQNGADAEAVALLLEQQKQAENLLDRQQDAIAERGLSDEETRTLLESNRTAAELLAATARESAAMLNDTAASTATDVLMTGQREASAILLEAWMRVTEGRP